VLHAQHEQRQSIVEKKNEDETKLKFFQDIQLHRSDVFYVLMFVLKENVFHW